MLHVPAEGRVAGVRKEARRMLTSQAWMLRAGEFPRDDRHYFELLARAVFSAGLGPRVVESRWERIAARFRDFVAEDVGGMDGEEIEDILADRGVIRNRRKIEAVVKNARVFQDILTEHGSFHAYLQFLGADEDSEGAAEALSDRFQHLGRTSALLFLYSSGWRDQSGGPEE